MSGVSRKCSCIILKNDLVYPPTALGKSVLRSPVTHSAIQLAPFESGEVCVQLPEAYTQNLPVQYLSVSLPRSKEINIFFLL